MKEGFMRRKIKLFIVFLIAASVFACTSSETTKTVRNSIGNSGKGVNQQTYESVGVVKNIDMEAGKITVDHADIPGYMSAMEMTEGVKDKAILETVKTGDKIEFQIERTGSKIVFTKLIKIGEVASLKAAATYKTNCAECHGEKGEGAKKGISLIEGHALHHTEAENIDRVTNGKGKKMPAFKDKLSSEEIAEVVKFVRTEFQAKAKAEGKQDEKNDEKKGGHSHSH